MELATHTLDDAYLRRLSDVEISEAEIPDLQEHDPSTDIEEDESAGG